MDARVTDKRDAVVEAARDVTRDGFWDCHHEALIDALSALDETPEQRAVKCLRAWWGANCPTANRKEMRDLIEVARELTEKPDGTS